MNFDVQIDAISDFIALSEQNLQLLEQGENFYAEKVNRFDPGKKFLPSNLKRKKDLSEHVDYINDIEKLINFRDRKHQEEGAIAGLERRLEQVIKQKEDEEAEAAREQQPAPDLKIVKDENPENEIHEVSSMEAKIVIAKDLIETRQVKGSALVNLQNLLNKIGTDQEPANCEALLQEMIETAVNG